MRMRAETVATYHHIVRVRMTVEPMTTIVLGCDDVDLSALRRFSRAPCTLIWPAVTDRPTAIVFGRGGCVVVGVSGAPEWIRDVIGSGNYASTWGWYGVAVTVSREMEPAT
jgi:hypothetical protein